MSAAQDKQAIADQVYAKAYKYEQVYGACPQCLLAALQEVLGGITDETFKASYVLAGGGGLTTQGTCGALIGGMMALSAKYGRSKEDFSKGLPMDAYAMSRLLLQRFVEMYGSPICGDVQKKVFGRAYNFWDTKDFEQFLADGGHDDKCPSVVANTARWTTEMLLDLEEREQALQKP
jgi:C_GCAxxG_C_C family probable redox protein